MPIIGSFNSATNKTAMEKNMNKWEYNYLIELKTLWENIVGNIVENIAEKGEIARYEQFLLFKQCFQRLSVVDVLKRISVE